MDKIVNCVTFRNVEKFIQFLDKNLKCPYGSYDLNACLDELSSDYYQNGCSSYELSSWETKSRLPECIDYEAEYIPVNEPNVVQDDDDLVITF